MAMPLGLAASAALHPRGVAWAWGVNGIASVVASAGAITVAIVAGFPAATFVAARLLPRRWRTSASAPGPSSRRRTPSAGAAPARSPAGARAGRRLALARPTRARLPRSSMASRICGPSGSSRPSDGRPAGHQHDGQRRGRDHGGVAARVADEPHSPKRSPGPSSARNCSPRLTSAAPSSIATNSYGQLALSNLLAARFEIDLDRTGRQRLALLAAQAGEQRDVLRRASSTPHPLGRRAMVSRPPAACLVRDQALARELAAGLGESDVARRQDHVGLDQLVVVERVAVAAPRARASATTARGSRSRRPARPRDTARLSSSFRRSASSSGSLNWPSPEIRTITRLLLRALLERRARRRRPSRARPSSWPARRRPARRW